MCPEIKIGNKIIGGGNPVYIIAEIGCNFEDDFKRAEEMVVTAARAGADAVKFQTFIPEKLASKDSPKFWDIEGCPGETQLEEFQAMRLLTLEEYKKLKELADWNKVALFSTPSDEDSVELLEKVGVPAYKVSSMDITHFRLLSYIAKKGKPIILSTGASTLGEIKEAVSVIESQGNQQIIILHCITNYPTKIENVNLRMILHLKREFPEYPIGYSDHTEGEESILVLSAAVALGAQVIEKHFTFDKCRPGYDHQISADPDDLKRIVANCRVIEKALGKEAKSPIDSEAKARKYARRSLVATRTLKKGIVLDRSMIEIKRPGTGITPNEIEKALGKTIMNNIDKDNVIRWDDLK